MRWVVPDFESQSACDLKAAGAYRYAVDPTTALLCCSFTFDDDQTILWWPDQPLPGRVITAIAKGAMFVAHNAAFERSLWTHHMVAYHGAPEIPLHQWHDSMARAQQLALPGSLDKLMIALGMPLEKDKEGRTLTLSFSKPDRKTGMLPVMTPAARERIGQYCMSDTAGQTSVHRRIGWLPAHERPIWELSQTINDRGILLDMEFVRAAQMIVDTATGPLALRFRELTGGLNFGQIAKVRAWVEEQGVACPDLTSETVSRLLGEEVDDALSGDEESVAEPEADHLPPAVREALHIRHLIGSSSIKKLKAMEACVGYDGRARGLFRYHGTTPGRQTAGLFQPHNFPRGTNETIAMDVDAKVDAIMSGNPAYVKSVTGVEPVELVVGSLRHAILAAPGRVLMSGDYTGIQARTVLALAGQHDKTALMAAGADVYCDMAKSIYGREISKADTAERQLGKASVLGLGFQMGAPKFQFTAAKQGIDLTLPRAKGVVDVYRKEWAPMVPSLWYGLSNAAVSAVWHQEECESHGILYRLKDRWLVAEIPNGSTIHYYDPQPVTRKMPWSTDEQPDYRRGFTYRVEKQSRLITRDAFGGQLCLGAKTEVLTPRGYLAIVNVTKDDLLWDGVEWVVHDGLVYQGLKATINFGGIRMTADHKVLHGQGWIEAADGSYDDAVAICKALGGPSQRNAGSHPICRTQPRAGSPMDMPVRLRPREAGHAARLLCRACDFLRMQYQRLEAAAEAVIAHAWDVTTPSLFCLAVDAGPLPPRYASGVEQIWRPGYLCLRALGCLRGVLGRHGADIPAGPVDRAAGQRRPIFERQLHLGDSQRASLQPPQHGDDRHSRRAYDHGRSGEALRHEQDLPFLPPEAGAVRDASGAAVAPVYDLQNAGPRNRFAVRGADGRLVIVSNCENIVMKIEREMVEAAKRKLETNGFWPIMEVHDEIVCEPLTRDLDAFKAIMEDAPRWVREMQIPVHVNVWSGDRYKK